MNQLSNITPCKSNTYTLFSTNSTATTRTWSRTETSGRLICCNEDSTCLSSGILQQRLKYKVLQHQSSNKGAGIETPPRQNTARRELGRTSNCLDTTQLPVQLGNIIYQIDTPIAIVIKQKIETGEISTGISLLELQKIIAELRKILNLPSTDENVLYKNTPLSQYKSRYQYFKGADRSSKSVDTKPIHFGIPYKTGIIVPWPGNFIQIVQPSIINLYQQYFPDSFISLKNSQFIYVTLNDACNFTGIVDYLFPAQNKIEEMVSASVWGTNILSSESIEVFLSQNIKRFSPILTTMDPASNRLQGGKYSSKTGILLSLTFFTEVQLLLQQTIILQNPTFSSYDVNLLLSDLFTFITTVSQQNSQLIFIPVATQREYIEHVNFPPKTEITFPLNNDGIFTESRVSAFFKSPLNYVNQRNDQFKLLIPT